MRYGAVIISLLLTAGCNGDGAVSPPRPVDADDWHEDAGAHDADLPPDAGPLPDGGVTCARAPLGAIVGSSVVREAMAGERVSTRADVRWVLTSSEGCIDRYHPTGTVTFIHVDECHSRVEPGSVPVPEQDGVLTIDRTREPTTYELRGATTWEATITCEGEAPEMNARVGGVWALGRGAFDGDVLSGGIYERGGVVSWWDYIHEGAEFPESGDGCVEPPVDHLWGTASTSEGAEASLTWTRVSTSGCVDLFEPTGIAAAPTQNATCTTVTTAPPSAPIAPGDGRLVMSRFLTRPPLLQYHGATSWPGARTCTLPDGNAYIEHGTMGGVWARGFRAQFDGTAYSGSTTFDGVDYAWSITRLPPPAAAASPAP